MIRQQNVWEVGVTSIDGTAPMEVKLAGRIAVDSSSVYVGCP